MGETSLTESEIDAAVAVMRSGALRQGRVCAEFEKKFAEKVGSAHAVTSSSGSAALHLAYMTFLEPGDEVLVPSFTFFATASMVSVAGGKPVFCDVDPVKFHIDLEDAEGRVTEKTRAISPVHLFGNPCNVEEITKFAKKHNLIIVWDAAQAHGARYGNRDVGSLDEFVCYSFYPSKNMFVGEGGMTCTNDSGYAEKLGYLRMHGQTGKYYHTMLGYNYRMTDVEAAIGLEQLHRLDDMLEIRKRNAGFLNQALSGIEGLGLPVTTDGGEHAWHQYCVTVDKAGFGMDRDQLIKALNEKGIGTAIHYPRGVHQQPVYEQLQGKQTLPVTESLSERILALPVHHGLSMDDLQYIVDTIKRLQ